MASSPNVLRVNPIEETASYRSAVSRILVDIQSEHECTLLDIAETIGVSLGTISNAANRKTDLSPTYLKRIGKAYGPEMLNPYAALVGGRFVPLSPREADALPPLTASVHRLALAQSPESEGGQRITHRELLEMVPDLKAAQAAITALLIQAERLAA